MAASPGGALSGVEAIPRHRAQVTSRSNQRRTAMASALRQSSLRWGYRWLPPLLAAVIALSKQRADGDYVEYFAMARALLKHGTPAVRADDLAWVTSSMGLRPGTFQLGHHGF